MLLNTITTLVFVVAALSEVSIVNRHRQHHRRFLAADNPDLPRVKVPIPFPNVPVIHKTNTTVITPTPTGAAPKPTPSALGGILPPAIEDSGNPERPFAVGDNTFTTREDAVNRACSIQHNECADGVNGGAFGLFDVGDCDAQQETCDATL